MQVIKQVIKAVASHPGNCPATCRKYYVHLEQQIFKRAEQSIAS